MRSGKTPHFSSCQVAAECPNLESAATCLTALNSFPGVLYSDGTKISNDLLKASSGRLGLSAYRAGIVYACRACALSQM